MTLEEQRIITAIWGKDAEDYDQEELVQVVRGIWAMSDLIEDCLKQGKFVFIPIDTVH